MQALKATEENSFDINHYNYAKKYTKKKHHKDLEICYTCQMQNINTI